MARKGFLLNEEQARVFRGLMDLERRQVLTTQNRAEVPPKEDYLAPDVYIAKTPEDGIPALNSSVDPPVIEYIDCEIWRVADNGEEPHTLEVLTDFKLRVYNLYAFAIPGNAFIRIEREKFGVWTADYGQVDEDDHDTGTGTSTGSEFTTCNPVAVPEHKYECVAGVVVHSMRNHLLYIIDGCITKSTTSWTQVDTQGCCECAEDTGTGSGTATSTSTEDSGCDCLDLPTWYTSTIIDFGSTGCAPFNGAWFFRQISQCEYFGTLGTASGRITITAFVPGAGNQVSLTLTSGSHTATYAGTIANNNCCVSVVLTHVSSTCGISKPSTITVVPNCRGTGTGTATATGTIGTGSIGTATSTSTGTGTGTSGGGSNNCCPGMSANLNVSVETVPAPVSVCDCMEGNVAISYDSATDTWRGSAVMTGCPGTPTLYLVMKCLTPGGLPPGTWHIVASCDGFEDPSSAGSPSVSTVCDPFSALFTNVSVRKASGPNGHCDFCGGSVPGGLLNLTVTE